LALEPSKTVGAFLFEMLNREFEANADGDPTAESMFIMNSGRQDR
jgi:hypothetical protein